MMAATVVAAQHLHDISPDITASARDCDASLRITAQELFFHWLFAAFAPLS
jgi:hypothetical protein